MSPGGRQAQPLAASLSWPNACLRQRAVEATRRQPYPNNGTGLKSKAFSLQLCLLPAADKAICSSHNYCPTHSILQSLARVQRTSQSVALRSRLVISVTVYASSRCLPGSAAAATTAAFNAATAQQVRIQQTLSLGAAGLPKSSP